MNDELQKLQAELQDMQPAALDPALLDRFEMAIKGELEVMQPDLKVTEQMLARQKPALLPEDLSGRLVEVARKTPFPVGRNVVLFPGETTAKTSKSSRASWMASAAAVALAGALSAFFMGPVDEAPAVATRTDSAPVKVVGKPVERGEFVPASFNSGVQDASDLGVMWAERSRPMRVVKVVYLDQVKLLNEQGEEVVVEVPRVEYLMVPEKID